MSTNHAVHLRIFRGKELTYNANGESTNENHIVHLQHDTQEWKKYLSLMPTNGVIKAEVEKVLDLNKVNTGKTKEDADYYVTVEDAEILDGIKAEIELVMNPEGIDTRTPEQIELAELREMVKAMQATNVAPASPATPSTLNELKEARKAYELTLGAKPDSKLSIEELDAAIEAADMTK